ncbi:hypothetical protein CesoFtcFv8_001688 [Champsocephalus esox]|nr:hypothetical protein CesoFtcFv8_001688 [Champsocephalus esox]
MQRQLTAQSEKVMQQVETDGVYIPDTMMKNSEIPHVFAMDNLDWKMKTLESGSFNATTAIIIENQKIVRVQEGARLSHFYLGQKEDSLSTCSHVSRLR